MLIVDPENTIKEVREDNNVLYFRVLMTDPFVSKVKAIDVGDRVMLRVLVGNKGVGNSTAVQQTE